MSAVTQSVGKALLSQLLGFRKAPQGEGLNRFAEALCECSISVEHAIAVIETFDYEFPTLRDIRDAAHNLRPKFEAKVDHKKEWEAKYGKPDPAFARQIAGVLGANHVQERRAILWQSIRDAIFYTETQMGRQDLASIDDKGERINAFRFWKQSAVNNQRKHAVEVEAFREELERSGWDELMVYDWARGEFPPCALAPVRAPSVVLANPITQCDIDRELERAGRESGDGE